MYSSRRSRSHQRSVPALENAAGSLKAPQIQDDCAWGDLTWISRTRPASSVTTASKNCGRSTGNNRNETCPSGKAHKPSSGNQIVSGKPIRISSSDG